MRFLEDHKLDTRSVIGITSLLSNITTKPGSHKGGWARLLKCQLNNMGFHHVKILDNKDKLSSFDTIIFDLGAEYSGALNLFGGLDEKVYNRLKELKEYKGRLFSWRNQLADVNVLESRRNNSSTCEQFKNEPADFLPSVAAVLSTTQTFDHAYRTGNLLIGDSHTPSVWTPEFMIERRDGRTLEGMVRNATVKKYLELFKEAGVVVNHVLVHCSSIDVRHHACRSAVPQTYMVALAQEHYKMLCDLNISFNLVETMGIEDESRELPKTGYYKGTPFAGSWDMRNTVRNAFNGSLNLWMNGKQIKFPRYFFDEAGKLHFEVMEKPQSVHLSPEHYRWNLDMNTDRWSHEEGR